ncbi:MAG TPA: hypothetical protein VG537_10400 [Candidatus Kapabacteria bacterium]|jgi:hypothetical protein|nr:hypothetical protein [Candidatus Kapabacteria bacterium]
MAKNTGTNPPEESHLIKSRAEAEEKLDTRIKEGEALETEQITSRQQLDAAQERYSTWTSYNRTLLKKLFSGDEVQREYNGSGFGIFSLSPTSLTEDIREHIKDVHEKVLRLKTIRSKVELYE